MLRPLALVSLLFTPVIVAAQDIGHYTSKTPYQPQQAFADYEAAPQGYSIRMIQHVARHGSRGLSSNDDDDLMMQLYQLASAEGALTELGEQLGAALEDIIAVHKVLGYGQLSRLGEIEHEQTAARIVERHPEWLAAASPEQHRIRVTHSGRSRAEDSGVAFVDYLHSVLPNLKGVIEPAEASVETLYFHKAEGSEGFDDYRSHDRRLISAMDAINSSPQTNEVVEQILTRLFTQSFIERLAAGEFTLRAEEDPSDVIESPLDAVMSLYGLYSIAVNLTEELSESFDPFIEPEHAAWLAYLDDADSFYGRGPGFAGDDITYRAADALFTEMLTEMAAVESDDELLASFRFTHAQVTMPIATWLQLEHTQTAVAEDELYTYDTISWRGGLVSPMAANVQWEVYTHEDATHEPLVRMLHLEREIPFPANCQPLAGTDYYYTVQEITRCLAEIHPI